MKYARKLLGVPYAVFLALFVVVPLFFILFYAFTDANNHFSLVNIAGFFTNTTVLSTIIISVGIAALTTVICLAIAYPVAYILARSKIKKKNILLMLFIMPMWINFVLRINALRELLFIFGMLGKYNLFNTVLGMVYDFLPFMILPIYTTLIKLDNSLLEAAGDLGGNKFTVFTKVTLPLSMPGIISGITMVFMPAMTIYVISDTLGNGKITIIGKMIENYFGSANNWHMGSAVSLMLLAVIFLSMLISGKFKDDSAEVRGAGLW